MTALTPMSAEFWSALECPPPPIPCSGHDWDAPRAPSHPGAGQEPVQALQDGSRVWTKLKETHLSPS